MRRSTVTLALDQMREGARLVRMHDKHGLEFYVIVERGRSRKIADETAAEILRHPKIVGCKDALFPGLDQTFRMEGFVEKGGPP
jgi:hypothetical protein